MLVEKGARLCLAPLISFVGMSSYPEVQCGIRQSIIFIISSYLVGSKKMEFENRRL